MSAPVNKSTLPPPPPFYQLYSCPPPPPPLSDADAADPALVDAHQSAVAAQAAQAAALPLDIYAPPPPLQEPFLKFGEIHTAGFMSHELGADVPQLFKAHESAALALAAPAANADQMVDGTAVGSAATSAAAAALSTAGLPVPPAVDYTAALRLLNRQYMQSYLALLSALTTAPPPPPAAGDAADSSSSSGTSSSEPPGPGAHVERALKRLADVSANLSWLLTQLRPHQAMQTLVQMLMRQIERRKKKTEQVKCCIAEAKEFLAAHGVHYAEGSTNIVPDPALNSSVSISASGVVAAPAAAVAAIAAALKPESGADGMEIDPAPSAVVKLESGAASSAAAAAVPAATPAPAPAAPLDSVAQLRSFLDSISDE